MRGPAKPKINIFSCFYFDILLFNLPILWPTKNNIKISCFLLYFFTWLFCFYCIRIGAYIYINMFEHKYLNWIKSNYIEIHFVRSLFNVSFLFSILHLTRLYYYCYYIIIRKRISIHLLNDDRRMGSRFSLNRRDSHKY